MKAALNKIPAFHPNRNVHRFALFTAVCTFCLLIAGALVTSNDAGLSVPDWPLSYGSLMPPMVGGIFYEHGHRMIATFVGMLSVILAVWLWRVESRSWLRWLGVAAVGAVIAQGILGGITVLFFLPPPISAAHATLAQLFFCTLLSIALFTSAWWEREAALRLRDLRERLRSTRSPWPRLRRYCVQLMLGAAFRHKGFGIIPHLVGAAVVTGPDLLACGSASPARSRRSGPCADCRARTAYSDRPATSSRRGGLVVANLCRAVPPADSRDGNAYRGAYCHRRFGACLHGARYAVLLSPGELRWLGSGASAETSRHARAQRAASL